MLTLELDRQLEASLLEIARLQHQTPEQLIQRLLAQFLQDRQASDLLVNVAFALPTVEAFAAKDPLQLQQVLRDEWH
jgi:hypothetical protein